MLYLDAVAVVVTNHLGRGVSGLEGHLQVFRERSMGIAI
jgi:hypothetical protein